MWVLRNYCYLLGLNSPTCPWEGLRGMGAGMGEDGRKGRRGEGRGGEGERGGGRGREEMEREGQERRGRGEGGDGGGE